MCGCTYMRMKNRLRKLLTGQNDKVRLQIPLLLIVNFLYMTLKNRRVKSIHLCSRLWIRIKITF